MPKSRVQLVHNLSISFPVLWIWYSEIILLKDAVFSVGIFRGKPLPLTLSAEHSETGNLIDIKEVWFAGVHSDMYILCHQSRLNPFDGFSRRGGSLEENISLNLSPVPLLWMGNEAQAAGLQLESRVDGGLWDLDKLQQCPVNESLTGGWKLLEYLPLTHLHCVCKSSWNS
jgi:hypothetical protein